jgi:uncharacterized membrane protein YqjE
MDSPAREPEPGLASAAASFVGHALKLLGVRASLATLELADARDAALRVLLLGAAALGAATLALISVSALIVMLAWDTLGWHILLILTVVYGALAAGLLWRARAILASGLIGLPLTLSELRKDRAALFGDRDVGEGDHE